MLSPNQLPRVLNRLIANHFDSLEFDLKVDQTLFIHESLHAMYGGKHDEEIVSLWGILEGIVLQFREEFSPCWEDISFIGAETHESLISKFQPVLMREFNLTEMQGRSVAECLYANTVLCIPSVIQ